MRGNKMRVAILISGGGTTMEAIIKAAGTEQLPFVEIVCVVATKKSAGGIERAVKAGVRQTNVIVHRPHDYENEYRFGEAVLADLERRGVDFISLNGCMVHMPDNVVEEYDGAMANQHPGPLRPHHRDFGGGGMYGKRVHCARLNFVHATKRYFWTEVVCQRVDKIYDLGRVVKMQRVPIHDDDNTDSLQQRALPVEHQVQIAALHDFSLGKEEEVAFGPHDDLVFEHERETLAMAKAKAIEEWPNG